MNIPPTPSCCNTTNPAHLCPRCRVEAGFTDLGLNRKQPIFEDRLAHPDELPRIEMPEVSGLPPRDPDKLAHPDELNPIPQRDFAGDNDPTIFQAPPLL